ncbi:nucleotidyltransferase domain-containing protein [Providencia alcalifaciens]|uniref:nucleotidyltransferase domain-containing protein n=1 Tax=Providencia alcalifaciens TaxID=126385 RepID=UPI0032DB6568
MMTLNLNGYIPMLEEVPIQSEFQEIITETVEQLAWLFKTKLHSVYAYGSVARGSATPQQSDLDLCVILLQPATVQENAGLTEMQLQLVTQYSNVSKIDFDIGLYSEVIDKDNLYSWGYWIKHQCRCICGADLSTQFNPFMPSRQIAEAVNGDFVEVLNGYIQKIKNCNNFDELKLLQRAAARKLIRSTDVLRLDTDRDWPSSLKDYMQKFTGRYPEQKSRLDYFFTQSLHPSADANQFIDNLIAFINWLDHERNIAG